MSFRPGLGCVALVVSVLVGAATEVEGQGSVKGTGGGFRLFARAFVEFEANRVSCGISSDGEICFAPGTSIIGAEWPTNSAQGYIFNSGLQVAGVVEPGVPGFSWSGDTTGAFFYDAKGTTQHGREVEPIWNYADAEDRASWPAMARVGVTDPVFAPALRGLASASEGDLWSMMWEGDTALMTGRPHPLGIAIETRVLGWNYPSGNQDIIYFVHTIYNVTSSCAADYAGVRPELRDRLIQLGQRFQGMNNARFGVTIPACGYDITDLYVGSSSDHDVSSDAGNNYGSVNLPLALGYSYNDAFRGPDFGGLLPADLRAPPFLNGYGFVGTKFLATPAATPEEGIELYTVFTGGGIIGFPQNAGQLWRYLGGNMSPALGDGSCNYFDPLTTHICYIKGDGHSDTRAMQSAGPTLLAPGGSLTISTAYVFASAVASPGCPTPNCPSVGPGNALRLIDPVALGSGVDLIDSMTGFRGYVDDNGDGVVQGSEFRAVRGSLIHKAQMAQEIFDRGFLIPTAPVAPEFFLVPGDDQVAVLWRPSSSEMTGDPFFELASDPAGIAYDPNFRQFDVEGYRIYRGRVDDPSRLSMIAQYDYIDRDSQGHESVIRDHLGAVNPGNYCAPELGRNSVAEGCPIDFDQPAQGSPYTAFVVHDVASVLVQVRLGDRFLDAAGVPYTVAADTATTGGGSGYPELWNSGVPFVHVDSGVRNNLRYFYSVTAFDINSIQSGPSSLESARVVKGVTPVALASNYENQAEVVTGVFGRGVRLSSDDFSWRTINSTTGVFDRPAAPATAASIALLGSFLPQLVTTSGELSLTLDSMTPGSAYDLAPATFWFSATSGSGAVSLPISIIQDQSTAAVAEQGIIQGEAVSAERVARYGGNGEFRLQASWDLSFPGNYYTAAYGRGCVNSAAGFFGGACNYNGARWFDDSVETFAHPTRGNGFATVTTTPAPIAVRTNAGSLTGVANVYEPRSYHTRPDRYREVEGVLGTVATAADYRVWWGAGGRVDSVVDITHNVRLPFDTDFVRGYTWGFLTLPGQSGAGSGDGRPAAISITDFGCVPPLKTYAASNAHLGCAPGTTFGFDSILDPADFGPLAFGTTVATDGSITPTANPGFGMYLAGHLFLFEMNSTAPTAPAAGELWTLRTYVGAIGGGGGSVGTGGNQGAYSHFQVPSPFTAVGASLKVQYSVTNTLRSTTRNDLVGVHTIPDPYYRTNSYETSDDQKVIKFVNLPDRAIIRIYSLSGILVRVIEHNSSTFGGQADWDVRNSGGRLVASGVYFYHLESPSGARRVGRMTLVTDGN